jgi:hypothetical protein
VKPPRRRACLGVALTVAGLAAAQEAPGFSFSGDLTNAVRLAYPASPFGGTLTAPGLTADCRAALTVAADSDWLGWHLGLSAVGGADGVALDLREAEAALRPRPELVVRFGKLQRNFGVGGYGSPANPLARAPDQAGYWGLQADWTPAAALTATAALSFDRSVAAGRWLGAAGFDGGALARWSPGGLDLAVGAYASGAGAGEGRGVAALSLPLGPVLALAEAAVSWPASGTDRQTSGSLRAELRAGGGSGVFSLEASAAYRGVYPGRAAADVAAMAAAAPVAGLPGEPFAPFYGRHYAELALRLEAADRGALETAAVLALPAGGLDVSARLEWYWGDAAWFCSGRLIAGDGEFALLTRSAGRPLFELATGLTLSF